MNSGKIIKELFNNIDDKFLKENNITENNRNSIIENNRNSIIENNRNSIIENNRNSINEITEDIRESLIFTESSMRKNLYKIKISSSVYRTLNYDASINLKKKARILNSSIILFSTAAGSISVLPFNLGYLSGALSFLVSILSVIKNTLQLAEKTQIHYENYKDYRKLVSSIDDILSSETINLDLYGKIENSYNDILEKTPIFNDEFLTDFKKNNIEFIKAASKSGLIPDILLNFDSIVESDLFYQYNDKDKDKIIQECNNLTHIIPIPKISELKKLQISEPIINDVESCNNINEAESGAEEEMKLLANTLTKYRTIASQNF